MSLIDKYKCTLEKIVKIEESSRTGCGYRYDITINLNGREKTFYFDITHKFKLAEEKIKFEKNKKPTNINEDWDYKTSPIELAVIGIMPSYEGVVEIEEIRDMFNIVYTEHERRWKVNCKKEECNNCMECEQT